MFKVGDVVKYVGDTEAQFRGDETQVDWNPPTHQEGLFVVERVCLATGEDFHHLRTGVEVYKIYARGTFRLMGLRNCEQIIHFIDMYWDFELRDV